MKRTAVREVAYHLIAVAILLGLYYLFHRPEQIYEVAFFLIAGYLVVGGMVVSASRHRGTVKTSRVVYVVLILVVLFVGIRDSVLYYQQTSATSAAYEQRRKLINANDMLSVSQTAILDGSLLTGSESAELLVTPAAVHYHLGQVPTTRVGDKQTAAANFEVKHGMWLPDVGAKQWRVWLEPSFAVDFVLFNRGSTPVDISSLKQSVSLVFDNGSYDFIDNSGDCCFGLFEKSGRFWREVDSQLQVGTTAHVTALFDFLDEPESISEIILNLPVTTYHYRTGSRNSSWAVSQSLGDSYGDEFNTQYAASWGVQKPTKTWVKVATFSGLGGTGWLQDNSSFANRRSQPFLLSGAPYRLQWTIKSPGPYPADGPYIWVGLHGGAPITYLLEPQDPILETDFYHSSSEVFDNDPYAAGSYVLDVSAANCRWKLELWQETWQ